jgi:hypothetical protein
MGAPAKPGARFDAREARSNESGMAARLHAPPSLIETDSIRNETEES